MRLAQRKGPSEVMQRQRQHTAADQRIKLLGIARQRLLERLLRTCVQRRIICFPHLLQQCQAQTGIGTRIFRPPLDARLPRGNRIGRLRSGRCGDCRAALPGQLQRNGRRKDEHGCGQEDNGSAPHGEAG